MFDRSRVHLLFLAAVAITLAVSSTATAADGVKIIFVSDRDGNRELYIMNRDGSGQTRLTNTPEAEACPDASPDGRTIAFLRQTSAGYSIYLMDREGTNVRPIPGALADDPLSWSPDGNRIAYAHNERIHTIRTNGSDLRVLSPSQVADTSPSWSPDGLSIVFVRYSLSSGPNGIFKMSSEGGGAVPVALHNFLYARFDDPSWSPDGDRIVFTYPNQGDLASNDSIAYFANGIITSIVADPAATALRYGPKYSPDGQEIVLYQGSRDSGPFQITSLSRVLTNGPASNFSPDWLPMRATADISGRVMTPNSTALRNASVVLSDATGMRRIATTSSFGTYAFDDLQPGRQYTVSVVSKRYRFQARSVTPDANVTGFDFVGLD